MNRREHMLLVLVALAVGTSLFMTTRYYQNNNESAKKELMALQEKLLVMLDKTPVPVPATPCPTCEARATQCPTCKECSKAKLNEEMVKRLETLESERAESVQFVRQYQRPKEIETETQWETRNIAHNLISLSQLPGRIAVIRPFVAKQGDLLANSIRDWKNPLQTPCIPGLPNVKADLLLYFSKNIDDGEFASLKQKLRSAMDETPVVSQCFGKAEFLSAALTPEEDTYVAKGANNLSRDSKGVTLMFYRLFQNPSLTSRYDYFFYMEPDNFPIRPQWLPKLYMQTVAWPDKFWMKGATFGRFVDPGNHWVVRDFTVEGGWRHLNGNAIYRLGDAEFNAFLKLTNDTFPFASFDQSMNAFFFDSTKWRTTNPLLPYFLATPFIQNYGDNLCDIDKIRLAEPHTFVLHCSNPSQGWTKTSPQMEELIRELVKKETDRKAAIGA